MIKLMRIGVSVLLFGSVCLGANDDADSRRGAQNIASVFHAGVAAGATQLQKSGSVEAAVQLLKEGVTGTGDFDEVVFRISDSPKHDFKNVSPYLGWDEKSSMLMYGNKEKEDVQLPNYATSLRNAQNLASVWSTAVADGAKVLDIKSATEAVKILTNEGIEGEFLGGRFVMKIADEREVAAALEHLAWDDQAHLLNYHPQSDPKFSRRYSENEVMREALRENGERTEEPIREEVTEKLRKEVDRVFDQSHDPAANVAIARVQAMNAACAALIQGDGRAQASLKWQAASNAQERYALLSPFLAFAPGELDEYFPEGYGVEFPETLTPLRQLKLWRRAEVSY